MSLSSALSSATTGLGANSRAADVISSNLANALTPGYGPRALELQTLQQGVSGVGVSSITRNVDQGLLADRRMADAEASFSQTQAEFLGAISSLVGTPEDPSSLAARLNAFEASLITASTVPDSQPALEGSVQRASELANALNRVSSEITQKRTLADNEISAAVNKLNSLLGNVRDLNSDIASHSAADQYAATLLDQRQAIVDEISTYVPVRQVARDNGTIALFSQAGTTLLDIRAASLEFNQSNIAAPHMTVQNGLLSELSINGQTVDSSVVGGGKLGALFSVRDDLAVDAQNRLDAVAGDLISRFQDPSIDTTRTAADPGLFTDAGATFVATNETGVAGRIELNTRVDPSQGGQVSRLRDGLGAVGTGPSGNGIILTQLSDALRSVSSISTTDLGSASRTASAQFGALSSRFSQDTLFVEQSMSFANARQSNLKALELQKGVDTDAEMQQLLLVEQAYAANARMIQTIDEMMQSILRI